MLDMLHLLTVVSLFAGAWLISRGAAYVARRGLAWHDRHSEAAAATVDVRIANVKRRETTVAVIRAAIAYAAFAIAIVLSAAQLTGGLNKLTTLAGASFVIILAGFAIQRSEEHTSELQSQSNLVCRLLLEKKKKKNNLN